MSEFGSHLIDNADSRRSMLQLAETLFPIHRTLVNSGFERSLNIISEQLPLDTLKYPSGTQVWDWTIPNSWDVREAYVADSQGRRIIDFGENNLHLSAYSKPFKGTVTRAELLEHVKSLKDEPDAIPYNFLYYTSGWQFNVAHRVLETLTDEQYEVYVDVVEEPGMLSVGTCHLPGSSEQEIIVSTYLCHPSMANDNLSGVIVAVELFKLLTRLPRRHYSYRLLIVPETIGSIAYLAGLAEGFSHIAGAYVVYDCGDPGPLHYKTSYDGGALVDRCARHVLKHYCPGSRIRAFDAGGSDERQFNAPGVRIPAGAMTRTPAGRFREYHTSMDTLDLLSGDSLLEVVLTLLRCILVMEDDVVYTNTYRGEPCFSKHRIAYPSHHEDKDNSSKYLVKKLAHEFDGRRSLLDIADKLEAPFEPLRDLARQFHSAGLVTVNGART